MLASSYLILGTVPPIVANIGGSNSPADDAAESGRLRHAAGLGGRPIESSNGGATSLSVRIRHGREGLETSLLASLGVLLWLPKEERRVEMPGS